MEDKTYHAIGAEETLATFTVTARAGLSMEEAAARFKDSGPNELPPEPRPSPIAQFFGQFNRGLTYVLIAAAGLSVASGHPSDAIGIVIAVLIDAIFGFVQERRAERALTALRGLVMQEASVVRDGRMHRIAARDVVPGDILRLVEGDRVAADARLIEAKDLQTDESALTGESSAVGKSIEPVPANAPVADRLNMVWMGTAVVAGQGLAVVTATGERTAMGGIARSLMAIRRGRTPLESRLDAFGRQIAIFAVLTAAIVFAGGLARGESMTQMFFYAVALLVSVIPEGLPAVLAVVLAIGVRRMAKRKAIVRHVPSVETLGAADVICTDKTGTLTENKMTVREIATAGARVQVSGEGWAPEGEFTVDGKKFDPMATPELARMMMAAAMATRAALEVRDDRVVAVGDPSEAAYVTLALKAGVDRGELAGTSVLDEIPFSSSRRYRAALVEVSAVDGRRTRTAFMIGAFETVAARCDSALQRGSVVPYDDVVQAFREANEDMAGRALRTLAVASVDLTGRSSIDDEQLTGMTMLGLTGMIDPARHGVRDAVERCRRAGIRVIMLTGDQKATATAIARETGILDGGKTGVHTESEVAAMDDVAFAAAVRDAAVFARVTPETKLRVVTALQQKGHTVAMTGDGVNDAPALKKASIGIAMGRSGTDVSRETADMVLADDNFVTIVSAVEEGRIVFRNVRQTTAYLLMTNLGEVVTVLAALFAGLPLPFLPAQILWLNLVIDGFPDVALATEHGANGVLDVPPRKRNEPILAQGTLLLCIVVAAVMGATVIALFLSALPRGEDYARSVAFTAMAALSLWNVFTLRSLTRSAASLGLFSNPYVNAAAAFSAALQAAVLYVPFLQATFRTVPLGAADVLRIVGVTSVAAITVEGYKFLARKGLVRTE